jgi:hypothetical protein
VKTHLAFSNDPLSSGSRVSALCGVEVEDARTVCVWDDTPVMAEIVWPLGVCRKCIRAGVSDSRKYVYVVSGGGGDRDAKDFTERGYGSKD